MVLNIPDEFVRALGSDEKSVLIEIAVCLYKQHKMTLARAARMVGTDRDGFHRILAERNLDMNYTVEQAEADMRNAREISEQLSRDRRR